MNSFTDRLSLFEKRNGFNPVGPKTIPATFYVEQTKPAVAKPISHLVQQVLMLPLISLRSSAFDHNQYAARLPHGEIRVGNVSITNLPASVL